MTEDKTGELLLRASDIQEQFTKAFLRNDRMQMSKCFVSLMLEYLGDLSDHCPDPRVVVELELLIAETKALVGEDADIPTREKFRF